MTQQHEELEWLQSAIESARHRDDDVVPGWAELHVPTLKQSIAQKVREEVLKGKIEQLKGLSADLEAQLQGGGDE